MNMTNYVLRCLDRVENALHDQKKVNRNTNLMLASAFIFMLMTNYAICEQNQEIKALKKELKKFNEDETEGEVG